MKTAFAIWNNRIGPVFDVARLIHIVETDNGIIIGQTEQQLRDDIPAHKALRLVELGINTLVCGAISRPLQMMFRGYGIHVIPFVAGELPEIKQAWLSGRLRPTAYAMPGCHRRTHRGHFNQGEFAMNGRGQGSGRGGGRGQGGGRGGGQGGGGRGQGGRGRGGMGGPVAGRPGGNCRCPQCGHIEPHEQGVPCMQRKCPQCGATMTRE
ncbi:MAG: hypothetical protein GYA46_09570 [candidate division Zixibacteria bacterium]|nr:hypothetical protein [candidate division Zixibacteria bacterium]